MFLSIVIPAYNCQKYIANCISSLNEQDIAKEEYEIIVVNDGSTDGTAEALEALTDQYSNLRILHIENHGCSFARNLGLQESKGEYVFFCDSDDYIAHNVFGKLERIANEYNPDLIYFGAAVIKRYDDYSYTDSPVKEYKTAKDCFASESINNGAWAYCVKREFLIDRGIQFIENRRCEDGMFTMDVFSEAGKTVFWNIRLYKYVLNETGFSKNKNRKHLEKVIDDFEFCVYHIKDICDKKCDQEKDAVFIEALRNRYGSYLFLMLVRVLKFGDYRKGAQLLKKLEGNGLYPIQWIPYDNWKIKLSYYATNHKTCFLAALKLMQIKQKITGK